MLTRSVYIVCHHAVVRVLWVVAKYELMYRPSRPLPNLAASGKTRGPEMGDPEMEKDVHWEMVLFNLSFHFSTKTSTKEQFPLSLGPQRGREVVDEPDSIHTYPLLLPVSSCGWFKCVINRTTHAPSARMQESVTHMLTPLRTGNETPGPGSLHSPSLPHCR